MFPSLTAKFKGNYKKYFCYCTCCGSNPKEGKKERVISHDYSKQPRMQKEIDYLPWKTRKREELIDFATQILRRTEEEEDWGPMRVAFGYAGEKESMDSNIEAWKGIRI